LVWFCIGVVSFECVQAFGDRPDDTVAGLERRVRDRLTPKQEVALEAAHARGYYQWPRDSTAEDIADAFDLSAPTVHYRLRKAHQTVVGSLLEDRTAPEDP
jgi:predicted DNA binding protein